MWMPDTEYCEGNGGLCCQFRCFEWLLEVEGMSVHLPVFSENTSASVFCVLSLFITVSCISCIADDAHVGVVRNLLQLIR